MGRQRSPMVWFVASLLFGLAAAFVAHSWIQSVNAGTPVVVAARELSPLSQITASDVRIANVPRAALPQDAVVSLKEVEGQFVRTGLVPGMIVQRSMLAGDISEGMTGLDARLTELEKRTGKILRAFPLVLDQAGGFPLVRVGQTVDVIAQVKLGNTPTSGVLIADAIVLEKISETADKAVIGAPGTGGSGGESKKGVVVLAVTPTEAARLAMAVDLGRVTLAVVPLGGMPSSGEAPVLTGPELFNPSGPNETELVLDGGESN